MLKRGSDVFLLVWPWLPCLPCLMVFFEASSNPNNALWRGNTPKKTPCLFDPPTNGEFDDPCYFSKVLGDTKNNKVSLVVSFAGLTRRSQRGFLTHPEESCGEWRGTTNSCSWMFMIHPGWEVLTCGLQHKICSILRFVANLRETWCPKFLSSSIHAVIQDILYQSHPLQAEWQKTSIIQLHAGNNLWVVSIPNCSAKHSLFKESPCNQHTNILLHPLRVP